MDGVLIEKSLFVAFMFLGVAVFLVLLRLFKGPSLADRVVAVDLFGTIILSSIALYSILFQEKFFVDVALVLALFAFVGTVVFARFITSQGSKSNE